MTVFPVIVRELRAESRHAFNYWLRVLGADRKSTRLNSSHLVISYAVFCLKKKKHASVVVTRLCSSSKVHKLRISALRSSVSLLTRRTLFWSFPKLRLAAADGSSFIGRGEL